jgi:TetR/AcrR family tetracycline transcriptional repressor
MKAVRKRQDKAGTAGPADATQRRQALTRERIVAAALALLDEVGLDGLTMRRLAERLEVQAGALYRHVRDKDDLLDLLAEAICAGQQEPDPALPWRVQLAILAADQARALRSRRDAARIVAGTPPTGPERLRLIDATLRALLAGGFPETAALQAAALLNSYVTGLVLEEDLGPPGAAGNHAESPAASAWAAAIASGRYPSLARTAAGLRDTAAFGPEQRIAFGLEVLLAGLEWHLHRGTTDD